VQIPKLEVMIKLERISGVHKKTSQSGTTFGYNLLSLYLKRYFSMRIKTIIPDRLTKKLDDIIFDEL